MRLVRALLVLLGAILLVPATASAASLPDRLPSWQLAPTGVTAQFRGLSAVSSRVAWVSGTQGTVLRTVDGGRTWSSVGPPGTGTLEFRDIEAFDAEHAVTLSIGPGPDSRVYRTDDGGRHWRQTFQNPDAKAFYDCLAFFDPWRGLAMSDPVDGKFRMQATSDGGRSWHQIPDTAFPPALPGEAGFAASGQCVTTSGPADAWLATGGGAQARVLHSGDGGRHWSAAVTPLPSSASAGVFALAFRTPWQGVAIGGDFANPTAPGPAVALSGDRGRTWHTPPQHPDGYRSGLAWLGGTVLAVGPGGSDLSPDGGRHWTSFDTGSFDTVDCTPTGSCWASGVQGRIARLGR
ncbi:oxidoreductase [Amycolatopsis sp. NBC_01480]|uniref:oxidoreductase n=1 Tax=Amycolatopsis sp. NBC_01480 TaxID=2903562 RepID=UPI002E28D18F|nr:oxidoreductase [Amycolatopsis sp. NBC_01480]